MDKTWKCHNVEFSTMYVHSIGFRKFFCKYHRLPSHYNGAIDVNNMSTFVELKTNKNCMFKNSSMSAFCNSQKVRFSFQQSYEINNGKKHGSEI